MIADDSAMICISRKGAAWKTGETVGIEEAMGKEGGSPPRKPRPTEERHSNAGPLSCDAPPGRIRGKALGREKRVMNGNRKGLERRKHPRFRVRDGAFAVLRPERTKLGQILDFGLGGLAFGYLVTNGDRVDVSEEVDIFLAGDGFYLEGVPVKTIAEFKIFKKNAISTVPMRRCSLQFKDLDPRQVSQVEHFIRNCTMGEENRS